jgi:hypothetical protein
VAVAVQTILYGVLAYTLLREHYLDVWDTNKSLEMHAQTTQEPEKKIEGQSLQDMKREHETHRSGEADMLKTLDDIMKAGPRSVQNDTPNVRDISCSVKLFRDLKAICYVICSWYVFLF